MSTNVKILAHRCGMGRAPENTIAACRQALIDGADAFECDVRFTKDQEPVIIHTDFNQNDVQPVTGSTIPLNTLSWAELQIHKVLGSDQRVAHLDEVLSFVQETGLRCFIEPKEGTKELIPLVVAKIRQFDLVDKVGLLTFHSRRELLVQVKRLEPAIETSTILINPLADFVKAAESIQADRVIIGWSRINHFAVYNFFTASLARKVKWLKAKGIGVEGGFICTQRDVEWMVRNGISGLWTDDVPQIREFVGH